MPAHYLRRGRQATCQATRRAQSTKRVKSKTSDRATQPPASDITRPGSGTPDGDEDLPGQYRSKSMSAPVADWLRKPSPASKASHKLFLDTAKHDGFLELGRAIRDRETRDAGLGDNEDKGSIQEYMLTKFYLFMRDCFPKGLTGVYAYISGDDVMEHLLCHKGETAPSRHKLSKQAEVTFLKLENWVAKGNNWREALKNTTTEAGKDRSGRGRSSSRKKLTSKAPGLHSPASR